MKKIINLIIIFGLSILLYGCTDYKLVGEVEAVVISKEYKESYTTTMPMIIPTGKTIITTMRSEIHPEQYNVELKYKDVSTTINDKRLYESVKMQDKVKVNYYTSEDNKNKKIRYESKE
ncbi:hypothetical protein CLPU_36c00090 [Gottschalkia purinilytica]|uniref:Lipoprotein n=1 Tax=Gottschalkia purinilytica TaxID=1503 RepID=A0A0L0W643_GOTPU|nr:hypothetical protein [Gottschalkia purinilytica]KNF06993.1 hypothetical protein CLPU_36c00090 [Gottschalkia purinilytica]